jgi:hypothetical protein
MGASGFCDRRTPAVNNETVAAKVVGAGRCDERVGVVL